MAFIPRSRAHASAQPPRPSRAWLRRRDRSRGQTMVELALVLPIFVFTLMAVLEMGYFVAVGSAVSSASREAARYGATWESTGTKPYLDCAAIRNAARQTSGALVPLTDGQILITYETAAGGVVGTGCGSTVDGTIQRWHRIKVTVNYTYQPLTPLLSAIVGTHTVESVDRRSIVKP